MKKCFMPLFKSWPDKPKKWPDKKANVISKTYDLHQVQYLKK